MNTAVFVSLVEFRQRAHTQNVRVIAVINQEIAILHLGIEALVADLLFHLLLLVWIDLI